MAHLPPADLDAPVSRLLGLLSRVPDDARSFAVDEDRAEAEFGIGRELLRMLRAAGLPGRRSGGTWLFDSSDVRNASMHLDPLSKQRKILRCWARELGRPNAASNYRVTYMADCPEHHAGPCVFSLLVPTGRRVQIISNGERAAALTAFDISLDRAPPKFSAAISEILRNCLDIRFIWLPPGLRDSKEFVACQRAGSCLGIARYIVAQAHEHNICARLAYGRALTPPFSVNHHWAEFLVDGTWAQADPVMIREMIGWQILDPAQFAYDGSLGGIMCRLAASQQPLALHNGAITEPRLVVRRLPS